MTSWHSSSFDITQYELIAKHYSYTMIVLSLVIALLTTYLCMSVVENSWHDRQSRSLRRWQAYSSTLFSIGGWGCFYLGILALQLPIKSEFHMEFILLSLLPALVGGWMGFGILKSLSFTLSEVVLSAFSFTCGLVAMMLVAHWSFELDGQVIFYPKLLFWSFVPTLLLCGISLFLVKLHHRTKSIDLVRRIAISGVFGLALFSFPYTVLQSIDIYHHQDLNVAPHVPLNAMPVMSLLILFILVTLIVGHKMFYRVGSLTPIRVEDDEDMRWKKEKNIIDGFSDGVVIVDPEGGISHMNEAAKTLFAYGATDTLPLSIIELMPDLQLNQTVHPTQSAADHGLS
ncbi:MAG: MHYT domain-containing protein, partial [Vibrio sp.]